MTTDDLEKYHNIINLSLERIDDFLFEIELDDYDNYIMFNVKRIKKNLKKLFEYFLVDDKKKYLKRINRRLNHLIEEMELSGYESYIKDLINIQNLLFSLEREL